MDNSLTSYFGMKGVIDLRVADILAKQSALHHQAAMEQLAIASKLSTKAGVFTKLADSQQTRIPVIVDSLPSSAYVPQSSSPSFLPPRLVEESVGIGFISALVHFPRRHSLINFI